MSAVINLVLVRWPFEHNDSQMACYHDCIDRFGRDVDWLAFIDSDEFLLNARHNLAPPEYTIQHLLLRIGIASSIVLNWACFGSGGFIQRQQGLVTASYIWRASDDFQPNQHVKCIVRPRKFLGASNPHFFLVQGETVRPDGYPVVWQSEGITAPPAFLSGWRVNHYFTRSQTHWQAKIARGYRHASRPIAEFDLYDRNDVKDDTALRFAAPIIAKIRSSYR
jgi:hypothetical protein